MDFPARKLMKLMKPEVKHRCTREMPLSTLSRSGLTSVMGHLMEKLGQSRVFSSDAEKKRWIEERKLPCICSFCNILYILYIYIYIYNTYIIYIYILSYILYHIILYKLLILLLLLLLFLSLLLLLSINTCVHIYIYTYTNIYIYIYIYLYILGCIGRHLHIPRMIQTPERPPDSSRCIAMRLLGPSTIAKLVRF